MSDHGSKLTSIGVGFTKGGKPENPERNPRSTGETNYNNTTHMSSKFLRINTGPFPKRSPTQVLTPSNRA